ncbi:MAG: phosphohistidine phosphatase SixA [Gammaproteobacteria bacterium]
MSARRTLYVMRHGDAQAKATVDSERSLTPVGQAEVAAASARLPCAAIDLVVVSPFVRAQQTAEIVVRERAITVEPQECDWVTPSGRAPLVDEWLNTLKWEKALLISHQPLVGLLVEYYCGGDCRHFPTAGIVSIEGEVFGRGLCSLSWLTP